MNWRQFCLWICVEHGHKSIYIRSFVFIICKWHTSGYDVWPRPSRRWYMSHFLLDCKSNIHQGEDKTKSSLLGTKLNGRRAEPFSICHPGYIRGETLSGWWMVLCVPNQIKSKSDPLIHNVPKFWDIMH